MSKATLSKGKPYPFTLAGKKAYLSGAQPPSTSSTMMNEYPVLKGAELTEYEELGGRLRELWQKGIQNIPETVWETTDEVSPADYLTPKERQEINDGSQRTKQLEAKLAADREQWFKKYIPQYASLGDDDRKELIHNLICEMGEAVSRRAEELGFSIPPHGPICGEAQASDVMGRVIHHGLNTTAGLDYDADEEWNDHWCGL